MSSSSEKSSNSSSEKSSSSKSDRSISSEKIKVIPFTKLCQEKKEIKYIFHLSDIHIRKNYQIWWNQHEKYISDVFRKSGIDNAKINTNQDYVRQLINLFKKRESRY